MVDSDEDEDDVADDVGDDAPQSVPEGSSVTVTTSDFLSASYQGDEGGRRFFKKPSASSGSSKGPLLVEISSSLVVELHGDRAGGHVSSRSHSTGLRIRGVFGKNIPVMNRL